MYVTHVLFIVERSSTAYLHSRNAIHQLFNIICPGLSGYSTSQFLTQARLSVGPAVDSIQSQRGILLTQVELCREQVQILPREVAHLYLLGHVERRQLGFLHQTDRVAFAQ